jgi:tetratricopeptide (TPR) repeat protein
MTHGGNALSRTFPVLVLFAALWMPLPGFADAYGDVSQLMRSGKIAEALDKADQYLAARPRDPQMRFLKGVLQSESGRADDAIATFTGLTQEYPELPEPYNNLAVLYASRSEFDKARAALELAIRTNPDYATAHENLGDIYAQLASRAYDRAQQLDPRNTSVRPKLALIRQLLSPAAKDAMRSATPVLNPSGAGGKPKAAGGG